MTEFRRVALLSAVATSLFFVEYIPPFKRVHFPYDIHGYHYPLLHYAFQSLAEGRVPEWDPTIYCGLNFAGNVQAALFYPPNWLLFAANLGRSHLSYKGLEILVIAHFWLAFMLAYLWFRGRRIEPLPSTLGAGAFALSGYMLSQLNHVGVLTGCVWTPLALWGIDQSAERREWRPLWKVAAASALCFLAGYPPSWLAFCVITTVYALASGRGWRTPVGTVFALAFSLSIAAVQLLPALPLARLRAYDPKYGTGVTDPVFFASYFIPNYFDFGQQPAGWGSPPGQYLYLGVPVFFSLLWVACGRSLRRQLPALAVAGVALFLASDPGNVVLKLLSYSPFLIQALHGFNFFEGVAPAAALLTAIALADFLKRSSRKVPGWLGPVLIVLMAAWTVRQVWIWLPGGPDFPIAWKNALEPAVMLALFSLGIYVVRAEHGHRRTYLAAALLIAVWFDYKVFGTSRRFNADVRDVDEFFSEAQVVGMDDLVYRELRAHPEYRIAIDETGMFATDMRHFRLVTPQGFDPFISTQYRQTIERYTPFRSDREFVIPPHKEELLQLLGVRYFVTTERGPAFHTLLANPKYRQLQPHESYYRTFEYQDAQLPYRWETPGGFVERTTWFPEHRGFLVRSQGGGRFVFIEQFLPGWSARIDGQPAPIELWGGAFQAIRVGPGEHRLDFQYRAPGLRLGALISVASVASLWILVRKK